MKRRNSCYIGGRGIGDEIRLTASDQAKTMFVDRLLVTPADVQLTALFKNETPIRNEEHLSRISQRDSDASLYRLLADGVQLTIGPGDTIVVVAKNAPTRWRAAFIGWIEADQ